MKKSIVSMQAAVPELMVRGCVRDRCGNCQTFVLLSPLSQRVLMTHDVRVLCHECQALFPFDCIGLAGSPAEVAAELRDMVANPWCVRNWRTRN